MLFTMIYNLNTIIVKISIHYGVPKDVQIFSQGSQTGIWESGAQYSESGKTMLKINILFTEADQDEFLRREEVEVDQ